MTACFLFAAEPEISVKAEVDQAFITIGDPVEYTVTIRHGPAVEVLGSVPPPDSDILKIKKVEEIDRKEGEHRVQGRKFVLTAFKLGEFILDPVKIQYRVGKGEVRTIETNRIFLTVKSVAEGEEKTDIRGVKGVVPLPSRLLRFLLILGTLLAAAAAGVWTYLRYRKPPGEAPAPETVLSPEDAALARLNALFDSDLLRRGKIKEYYLQLSEILREYFESRFHVLAVESTTDEILRDLKRQPVDRSLLERIAEVLQAADLAKFAKWKPEPSRIVQINQMSKQIIETARPPQEAAHGV